MTVKEAFTIAGWEFGSFIDYTQIRGLYYWTDGERILVEKGWGSEPDHWVDLPEQLCDYEMQLNLANLPIKDCYQLLPSCVVVHPDVDSYLENL